MKKLFLIGMLLSGSMAGAVKNGKEGNLLGNDGSSKRMSVRQAILAARTTAPRPVRATMRLKKFRVSQEPYQHGDHAIIQIKADLSLPRINQLYPAIADVLSTQAVGVVISQEPHQDVDDPLMQVRQALSRPGMYTLSEALTQPSISAGVGVIGPKVSVSQKFPVSQGPYHDADDAIIQIRADFSRSPEFSQIPIKKPAPQPGPDSRDGQH